MVAICGKMWQSSRPRSAPFPHAHDISDISHALPRTSVSPKLPAVMSPAAARPDKTRQIDCETKQAPVAVMFSKVRGPDQSWGPSLFEGLFGWYRNRWKQNLDADAKLSRTRAGEIQTGYCSCSGIVGGGTDKLMCLIVQAIQQRFVNSWWFMMCVCVPKSIGGGGGDLCSVQLKHWTCITLCQGNQHRTQLNTELTAGYEQQEESRNEQATQSGQRKDRGTAQDPYWLSFFASCCVTKPKNKPDPI